LPRGAGKLTAGTRDQGLGIRLVAAGQEPGTGGVGRNPGFVPFVLIKWAVPFADHLKQKACALSALQRGARACPIVG
jgi:hypothetical protein